MKAAVIIVAAGTGSRMGAGSNKVYLPLCGRPVLSYAVETLANCPLIADLIIVTGRAEIAAATAIAATYGAGKVRQIVSGGATRSESVQAAFAVLNDEIDTILVHDGARPLVQAADIEKLLQQFAVSPLDGLLLACPMTDTVKYVENGVISATPDRSKLWRVQTPQVFRRAILLEAYGKMAQAATDDAAVVEAMGGKVGVLAGSEQNIKLTTPFDLTLAELLIQHK